MKPIVFVSSTIVDFSDLRSALKFWLEELEYEVRMSEWPGFPHPLDRQAAEAAIDALPQLVAEAIFGNPFPMPERAISGAEAPFD